MQKIPVYSLVAYSGSGKTTFLEKLIPELKKRGMRVAVVKHDAHNFELDREGKDSWRITKAGADVTAIVSETRSAVMENRHIEFEDIVENIKNVDIIITEGGKRAGWKKILLYRKDAGKPLAADPNECVAVVSDSPIACAAPCFGLEDACGVSKVIISDIGREK